LRSQLQPLERVLQSQNRKKDENFIPPVDKPSHRVAVRGGGAGHSSIDRGEKKDSYSRDKKRVPGAKIKVLSLGKVRGEES